MSALLIDRPPSVHLLFVQAQAGKLDCLKLDVQKLNWLELDIVQKLNWLKLDIVQKLDWLKLDVQKLDCLELHIVQNLDWLTERYANHIFALKFTSPSLLCTCDLTFNFNL